VLWILYLRVFLQENIDCRVDASSETAFDIADVMDGDFRNLVMM